MQSPVEDVHEEFQRSIHERKRRFDILQRRKVAAVLTPAFSGILVYIFSEFAWVLDLPRDFMPALKLLALILIGSSGVAGMLIYLQTGFRSARDLNIDAETIFNRSETIEFISEKMRLEAARTKWQIEEARNELERARVELERTKSVSARLGDDDKLALIADIKKQLSSEAAESVLAEIQSGIAASMRRDNRDREILVRFEESRARLSRELQALGFRGNLNLALGAITTVTGLSLLGWSVFQEVSSSINGILGMASHFLPRLTLVILIELFAFFFLSLYKSSLAEIKYFQNEITNLESKQIALKTAVEYGDVTMITAMVASLASTERNHVLSKDQTTVELEKAKIEQQGRGDLLKALQDLAKGKKD